MQSDNFLVDSVIAGGFPSISIFIVLAIMSVASLSAFLAEAFRISRNILALPSALEGLSPSNSVWADIDEHLKSEIAEGAMKDVRDRHLVEKLATKKHAAAVVLASVGSNAPYVGLLGTVIGVYGAMSRIGEGSIGMSSIAPPVGEALAMTAVGLLVAIPAVLGYNLISRGRNYLGVLIEEYCYSRRLRQSGVDVPIREVTKTITKIRTIKGAIDGFRASVS